MTNVFELLASINLDTSAYSAGLENASAATQSIGGKIGSALETAAKVGAAALTAASGAAVAFGTSAVQAGMEFDSTMSQVAAISGATGDDFDDLRDKAKEMGATTMFSASQSAEAFTYMAMAGWKTGDMLNGIEGIMNLAAASGADLATTSDIVTDALTAFGMTAADSGHFADVLAVASSNANTNVTMMGETFKYVAPLAGTLGLSAGDVAESIGLMANSGIKASQAGTSLRAGLSRLVKPTEEMQNVMMKLGLATTETYDAIDDSKIQKAADKVANATIGMEKAQLAYNEAVKKYGEDSAKAQSALLTLEQRQNSLETATRNLEAAQTGQMKTAYSGSLILTDEEGNMRSMNEAVDVLREAFSGLSKDEQAEAASVLFGQEAMSGWLAMINAAPEDIEKLRTSIENADGAAAQMADTMQDNLEGSVTKLKSALEGVQIAVSDELTPSIKDFVDLGTQGLSDLTLAINEKGLAGAMDALGPFIDNAIGMLMEGLPKVVEFGGRLLASIVGGIIDNLPKLAEGTVQLVSSLGQQLQENGSAIMEKGAELLDFIVNGALEAIPKLLETAAGIISGLGQYLREKLPELIPAAADVIIKLGEFISDPTNLVAIVNAAGDIIGGIIHGIVNAIPKLLAAAPQIIGRLAVAIIASIPAILEVGANIVGGLLAGIAEGFVGLLAAIPNLIKGLIDGFKDLLGIRSPSTVFKEIGDNLVAGLLNGITTAWNGITAFFSGAVESLKSFLSGTWEEIKGAAETAWNGVKGVFSGAWEGIQGVWNAAEGFFSGIWSGIETTFSNTHFISDQFQNAYNAIQTAWNGIGGFFSNRWGEIKNAFSTARDTFSAIGSDIVSGLKSGVSAVWESTKTFFSNRWEDIKNIFSNAVSVFSTIGGNIVSGLKNGIAAAWEGAKGIGTWFQEKVGSIATGAKETLGEHSPSKVFAGIGGNMALGLEEGWEDEFADVRRSITDGLSFQAEPIPVTAAVATSNSSGAYGGFYGTSAGGGGFDITAFQNAVIDALQGLSITAQFGTDSFQSMTVRAVHTNEYLRNGRG